MTSNTTSKSHTPAKGYTPVYTPAYTPIKDSIQEEMVDDVGPVLKSIENLRQKIVKADKNAETVLSKLEKM